MLPHYPSTPCEICEKQGKFSQASGYFKNGIYTGYNFCSFHMKIKIRKEKLEKINLNV